jgi:hypothetical protein
MGPRDKVTLAFTWLRDTQNPVMGLLFRYRRSLELPLVPEFHNQFPVSPTIDKYVIADPEFAELSSD